MTSPLRTASVGLVALALSGLVRAQAPTPSTSSRPAAQPQAAGDRLPVRRVVLYKSGVGYFEHLGRVRGNQTVTIDRFTRSPSQVALGAGGVRSASSASPTGTQSQPNGTTTRSRAASAATRP